MECIFCAIGAEEIPTDIIKQNDEFLAFPDINPKAPVHILIIPKAHIGSISTLSDDDSPMLGRMIGFAREVAFEKGIAESGFRLVFNNGRDAGMEVDHLHLHLLAGKKLGSMA